MTHNAIYSHPDPLPLTQTPTYDAHASVPSICSTLLAQPMTILTYTDEGTETSDNKIEEFDEEDEEDKEDKEDNIDNEDSSHVKGVKENE